MKAALRLFLLLLSSLFTALPAAGADLTLDEASGFLIDAQVNGRPVRLRVDTAAPGYIVLNPAAAQRVGLRPSMTRARTTVGPVELRGSTKAAQVTVGGTTSERRILWWDRDVVTDGADGIIGAADLPYDRVIFRYREPQAGEAQFRLPMDYDRSAGLTHRLDLGTQPVTVQVSARRPASMATAAAGALFAQVQGGAWAGDARQEPLNFGVIRPVRPLGLTRPLPIAGLDLAMLLVRTQDHRGGAQLPPETEADPDEIVVTGNLRRSRPRYVLTLGRDWLAPCSSMTWDKSLRALALSCRPAPAAG